MLTSSAVVTPHSYSPPQAIAQQYFKDSETHTVCGWKGTASYYSIDLGHGAVRYQLARSCSALSLTWVSHRLSRMLRGTTHP